MYHVIRKISKRANPDGKLCNGAVKFSQTRFTIKQGKVVCGHYYDKYTQ